MLLNALVALGLLSKSGDDYKNTPESARFFVQGSKDNHRNGLLHTANIWHRWSTLTDAVRSGTRVPISRDDNPEWTRNFIAGMQRNAKDRAPLVVKALGTAGCSPHPRSRRRLRRILHRVRQGLSRCAVRDPRHPRGRAAHRRICQPGRRLSASQRFALETCSRTTLAPATTSSC